MGVGHSGGRAMGFRVWDILKTDLKVVKNGSEAVTRLTVVFSTVEVVLETVGVPHPVTVVVGTVYSTDY